MVLMLALLVPTLAFAPVLLHANRELYNTALAGVRMPVRMPGRTYNERSVSILALEAPPTKQAWRNAVIGLLRRPWNAILRRRAGVEARRLQCGGTKYGCDPRTAQFALSAPTVVLDPSGAVVPDELPLANPGVVGELTGGVEHLNALLADAATEDRAVILKFKRDGCSACNSTVVPLATAAAAYAGRADFFTVDFNRNRDFCRQAGIAVVPSAHLYMGGKIVDAMPLGPSKWAEFQARLYQLLGAPDGQLVAPVAPQKKEEDFDDSTLKMAGLFMDLR